MPPGLRVSLGLDRASHYSRRRRCRPALANPSFAFLARVGIEHVDAYLEGGITGFAAIQSRLHTNSTTSRRSPSRSSPISKSEEPDNLTILDVREPGEIETGAFEDSIRIPLGQLTKHTGELDPGKLLVVHCKGGYRSAIASSILRRAGLHDIANLTGGYDAWKAAELQKTEATPLTSTENNAANRQTVSRSRCNSSSRSALPVGKCKTRSRALPYSRLPHRYRSRPPRCSSRERNARPNRNLRSPGISATSLNWTDLQQITSMFARTITYDRAGLGWSSPCTSERTPSNIVGELRLLLARAEIPPPYILVGHSFGGVVVRRFAIDHPDEVSGLVLVDPMRPEDWNDENDLTRDELRQGLRLTKVGLPCAHFGLARLAITSLLCGSGNDRTRPQPHPAAPTRPTRLFERLTSEVSKMPRETHAIVAAHWSSPHFYRGMADHLRAIPATVLEMREATPIPDIPIVVLTPATAEPLSREALDRISPTAQQIIAEKSTHWVHLDEPHLVLEAIRKRRGTD